MWKGTKRIYPSPSGSPTPTRAPVGRSAPSSKGQGRTRDNGPNRGSETSVRRSDVGKDRPSGTRPPKRRHGTQKERAFYPKIARSGVACTTLRLLPCGHSASLVTDGDSSGIFTQQQHADDNTNEPCATPGLPTRPPAFRRRSRLQSEG